MYSLFLLTSYPTTPRHPTSHTHEPTWTLTVWDRFLSNFKHLWSIYTQLLLSIITWSVGKRRVITIIPQFYRLAYTISLSGTCSKCASIYFYNLLESVYKKWNASLMVSEEFLHIYVCVVFTLTYEWKHPVAFYPVGATCGWTFDFVLDLDLRMIFLKIISLCPCLILNSSIRFDPNWICFNWPCQWPWSVNLDWFASKPLYFNPYTQFGEY